MLKDAPSDIWSSEDEDLQSLDCEQAQPSLAPETVAHEVVSLPPPVCEECRQLKLTLQQLNGELESLARIKACNVVALRQLNAFMESR